jgi:hypothetical protein
MEDLDIDIVAMKQQEKAQELEEMAYEAVVVKVDPIIDEMNILLGQIIDIADQGNYDFEERISELVVTELGL